MTTRPGPGLDYLLDLDGVTLVMEDGCWAKFEVRRVPPTPERPHGIDYCLTYHDAHNRRVVGFDNTHAVQPRRRGRVTGRRVEFDHQHAGTNDRGTPYEFESAEELMTDFWRAVDEWKAKHDE